MGRIRFTMHDDVICKNRKILAMEEYVYDRQEFTVNRWQKISLITGSQPQSRSGEMEVFHKRRSIFARSNV